MDARSVLYFTFDRVCQNFTSRVSGPNAADERGIIKSRGVHCRLESGSRSLEEDRRVCIASFSAPALSLSLTLFSSLSVAL